MQNNIYKEVSDNPNNIELGISVLAHSYEELHKSISQRVNFLINANFPLLLSFLYRLDVSEKKLREMLAREGDTPASELMATLIIERQLEKIEARKSFKNNNSIPEEEKW